MRTDNSFRTMSRWTRLTISVLYLVSVGVVHAGSLEEEIGALLGTAKAKQSKSAQDAESAEEPRVSAAGDGYLTHVRAPKGRHFSTGAPAGEVPEITAIGFLRRHGRAFGINSVAVDFTPLRTRISKNKSKSVRLQQTYAGLPIFSAQVAVQVDEEGGVESVLSDIARDTTVLDDKRLSTRPTLSAEEAAVSARVFFAKIIETRDLQIGPGRLCIYAPNVFDLPGPQRLAWEMEVESEAATVHERVLVDAHTGEVLRRSALIYHALNRQVYNANCSQSDPGQLARSEGQGSSGDSEVDNAYDFLGDTYDFYFNEHGRDSIDGRGQTLSATVRYGPSAMNCVPPGQAFWNGRMFFGMGRAVDDITAHELTHGVTASESALDYANDSGAINEAFSDIWGEFVDLGNGQGNDAATKRWIIAEDLGDGWRSMTNPPAFGDPDRLGSPLYVPPTNDPDFEDNDYGGVHSNSGIINKLCVLLTDGGKFNGFLIQGMGIPRVADLFYEVNVTILLSGANYDDLFNALRQAAVNLGWSAEERSNLLQACVAVEIGGVFVDQANTCSSPNGIRRCRSHGNAGPFRRVVDGVNAVRPGEYLGIVAGSYNEQFTRLDKPMTIRAPDGPVTIGR